MRRPDLPLILVVLALGGALAIFVDGAPPPPEDGPAAAAESSDPAAEFLADPEPGLLRCLAAGVPPGGVTEHKVPGDPGAAVARVAGQIEEIRELRFSEPVDARLLSAPELRAKVDGLLDTELRPSEARTEQEILELLGAVPPDTDLVELTREALGSQIIGLYEPTSGQLLVQSSEEPGAIELITLAHELEHALADQKLGLRDKVGGKADADRTLAYSAVLEGDATLVMERYALTYVGLADQLSLEGGSVPGADDFDELPDYVQRNLLFPYLGGLRLVCHRWLTGGWDAVDELYERPPASTDEVLFPARYGDGPPVDPPDPGEPEGWERETRRELGAAELEWLFAAPGGDPAAGLSEPRRLVASWAGGELELWADGDARALGISLVEAPEGNLLCGALAAWYRGAHPSAATTRLEGDPYDVIFDEAERVGVLSCRGDEVRMGIAPDAVTAMQLAT